MRKVYLILSLLMTAISHFAIAQPNVLNPADPEIVFSTTNRPAAPLQRYFKMGHTRGLSWDSYGLGYRCYYFKGSAFRIKFPKSYQHNVADGKKYPVFIFYNGLGEKGEIWDNENSLLLGGQEHVKKVNDGTFDGFLIYPQSQTGFYTAQFGPTADLVDSMIKYVKADPDRVILSGLSAGGQGVWQQAANYASHFAALIPISAAHLEDTVNFPKYITLPVWTGNGGLDVNPYPENATIVFNAFKRLGGNLKQFYMPNWGHSVWTYFWLQPGYYNTLSTYHKANPLVYFGRTEFCPGETINVKLGLQDGFYAYEWQKNGVTIPGATANNLTVTAYGTYRAHFKRTSTSNWSDWSPAPVVIAVKQPTVTPAIKTNGVRSKVLPAPDGSTTVPLMEPNTYASYQWRRVSDNALVSDSSVYPNAVAGQQYKVMVTEQYGCSSSFSPLFTVINANGANAPAKTTNVTAVVQSNNTSVKVGWTDIPNPTYNETAYEVYRGTAVGGPYTIAGITAANATSFLDQNLTPNTRYYYIVRAVNDNGAAPVSSEVTVTTNADSVAPTTPGNLHVTALKPDFITIYWNGSTDNVKVTNYAIYINGVRAYSTTNTSFTIRNTDHFATYRIYVKAEDLSGNLSGGSNTITITAKYYGLAYKYFEGNWSVVPDFSRFPAKTMGIVHNTDLTKKERATDYAFLWRGYINIKVPGTYYFETYSSAGSKVYIPSYDDDKSLYSAKPIVNNDGVHAAKYKGGSYTFSKAGRYSIAISYFQAAGSGEVMQLYWTCAAAGMPNRTLVPDSVFNESGGITDAIPAAPANLKATAISFDRIALQWTDNSSNETGFQLVRSTTVNGTYTNVASLAPNTTIFVDTTCKPSTTYYYKLSAVNSGGESAYNQTSLSTAKTGALPTTSNKAPVLNTINTVFLKPGATATTAIAATDDVGQTVTLSINNLPGFATYQKTGNGSGQITFAPAVGDAGMYTVNVTATDNYDASTVKSFNVVITDKNTRSFYVNIGAPGETPAQKPWNNLLASPAANLTLSNLRDENDAASSYSFTTIDKFAGYTYGGMITGTNSGIFSDDVIKTAFYESSTSARRVKFSGLNTAKKYNVVLYGSINGDVPSLVTFTSGLKSVTLNEKYNNNQAAQLNRLSPDANGEITVTITKDAAAYRSVLSAVVLEEYDNALSIVAPSRLLAEPTSVSKMTLVWADRADNETGYQIYRASSSSTTYSLIGTVGANVTTYADASISPNIKYYYQVRAVNGSVTSDYSNVADAVSAKRAIYVNFESGESPARSPWNNTGKELVTGAIVSTLKDNKSYYTGMGLTMISDFNDEHVRGVNTGNNSGIYPDSVMQSTCWQGPNQTTTYKLTNLDQSKNYRLWFFGSWVASPFTDYTTTYNVNGKTAYLNCYNNQSKAVYLDGLQPNAKGELWVDVYTPTTSIYGFQSSLVIEYYDAGLINQTKPGMTNNSTVVMKNQAAADATENEVVRNVAAAYPNPFTNQITISFNLTQTQDISLQVYDMNSKLILRKDIQAAAAGSHNETLNFSGHIIPKGTYFIRLVRNGITDKTIKVIKD